MKFCLLKHVSDGKVEERIEMTGKRVRRIKQLLDNLKDRRRYSKLKEEAVDSALWRTGFGRGCGHVIRQTTECMNIQDFFYVLLTVHLSTILVTDQLNAQILVL